MKRYDNILFHPENCLNNKAHYFKECRLCIDSCPHAAIGENREVDLDRCSQCGRCMAVCPSDGFVHKDIEKIIHSIHDNTEVTLTCTPARESGCGIPCLAIFDYDVWRSLHILGEKKKIRLVTGNCTLCPDRRVGLASRRVFAELDRQLPGNSMLDIEAQSGQPVPSATVADLVETRITRKERKFILRAYGKDMLKKFFPGLARGVEESAVEKPHTISFSRQLLLQALTLLPADEISYPLLAADATCSGCGTCVKICPQKALQLVGKGEKKQLLYNAVQCVQCNRCVETCASSALKIQPVVCTAASLNGLTVLIEPVTRYCLECGTQLLMKTTNHLCPSCSSATSP